MSAAANRTVRITKLASSLKRVFKPVAPPKDRTALEVLVYACLLENSSHDEADKAFAALKPGNFYFDWNEVRVSTRRELSEAIKNLSDPEGSADRVKLVLQSVFETVYVFDIELFKKQNLGQAVAAVEKYKGATPFVVAYLAQNALAGHSIPVNKGLLTALHTLDIITDAELAKGIAPGLERAIPKNKGVEVGSMMHQLGVEVGRNPYGTTARKLLTDLDPSCKDRLPKKPAPPAPTPPPKPPAPAKAVAKKPAPAAAPAKKDDKKPEPKKPEPKKPEVKKPVAKKPEPPKKPVAKKPEPKKPAPKKPAPPAKTKTSSKLAKKKPR
jgi:endonuclease III